ncbi:Crp/Fnr family transcriptional regulator [Reichenbachiella versicolor]|uniref:Crp/Fnr family transcriptional regulator n=1 Tax=Reichenbachiella versicolor TaxID=1821036 RepID=UPI001C867479|nr:Crp/Fnr family transcriptional regulator [Reichenbachiella versicolor]
MLHLKTTHVTFMKIDLRKFDFESNKILSSLSAQDQQIIMNQAETLRFKKGKLLFYENGIPTGVFIILSGRAKIFKTGLMGKDQIFYIYNKGDLMGYHALLCNENFEDSCEAIEDCEVAFISKSRFEQLMKTIPSLHDLLIHNMSHEFGVLVNVITVLAQKQVRERLALYLLILTKKYDDAGILISREDLANLIGTVRESLGRLLKELKEDGLITVTGRAIHVVDEIKLLRIASSEYTH